MLAALLARVQGPARPGADEGRRPVEAGPVVRGERAGGRGEGAPDDRHAARPGPRGGAEAAGVQEAGGPLGHRRAARRGEGGGRAPEEGRPRVEAPAGEVARHAGGQGRGEAGRGEAGPAGGHRPARGAGGLGRLRQGLGGPPGRRGAVAGPDRRPGGVARPGERWPSSARRPRSARSRSRRCPSATRATSWGCWSSRLRDPIKYEVRPVGGPGSPGVLFVEGEQYDVRRTYGTPAVHPQANTPRIFTSDVPFDPFSAQNIFMANGFMSLPSGGLSAGPLQGLAADPAECPFDPRPADRERQQAGQSGRDSLARTASGCPGLRSDRNGNSRPRILPPNHGGGGPEGSANSASIALDIQRATLDAQQRLSNDVRTLELTNSGDPPDERPAPPRPGGRHRPELRRRLARPGKRGGRTRRATAMRPSQGPTYKPVLDQFVEVPFSAYRRHRSIGSSCFGAGTPVRTREGSVADRGRQGRRPGARPGHAHRGPELPARPGRLPQPARRAAAGHARRRGDRRHRHPPLLEGRARLGHGPRPQGRATPSAPSGEWPEVTAVEPQGSQPVFNLEVAGRNTFFVGEQGVAGPRQQPRAVDPRALRRRPRPGGRRPRADRLAEGPVLDLARGSWRHVRGDKCRPMG